MRRKSVHITGIAVDEAGKPVVGASVSVNGMSTLSVEQGRFDLVVPSDRVLDGMVLRVSADRYETCTQVVVPNGGPVTAVLRR